MKGKYLREGEPFVWCSGAALALILLLTLYLLVVIFKNGMGVFWIEPLAYFEMKDGSTLLGEVIQTSENKDGEKRFQLKIANRDLYSLDFKWIFARDVESVSYPHDAVCIERLEYGNFIGFFSSVSLENQERQKQSLYENLLAGIAAMKRDRGQLDRIESEIGALNHRLESVDHKLASLRYNGRENTAESANLLQQKAEIQKIFGQQVVRLETLEAARRQNMALFTDVNGTSVSVPLASIVRIYKPNELSFLGKVSLYFQKTWELFFDDPRESNTEGGLFPAIFGTVMLIVVMALFSFPLGVVAGVYLREYARDGFMVRLVRIAVNNLAGIPSIVYGIFGLAFFVYGIGSSIDQLFFPARLPAPTFGTGGILWASLTLGLLTIPVVIVSTEEALGAVPCGLRESSYALGATRFQTLTRILLPMASPGIMTGFILAMARAAGEVAPLMITGVVKLAPALPLDLQYPFFHLNRKFMHLGFHIYDIGFQSPNVEAAKPMVFVTTLLLLGIVIVLTSTAIVMRNRMKKRFAVAD
jgi:phosphate transport system permease protein